MHQGQICMTTGRHLVHESVYDAYVDRARREGRPPARRQPGERARWPRADHRRAPAASASTRSSRTPSAGARLAAGGTHDGLVLPADRAGRPHPDNPAFAEEIFGPVAPVMWFSTDDEAVELVNANEYGLSVGILGDVGGR